MAPAVKGTAAAGKKTFSIITGKLNFPDLVGIYGPGGIGKTELIANAAQAGYNPILIDVDGGSNNVNIARIGENNAPLDNWSDLRDMLHSYDLLKPFDLIGTDSLTRAEELCVQHVLGTVPRGDTTKTPATSIESYGWGKGYTHVFENFLPLLSDLDQLRRRGKTVIVSMHECVERVPNPAGEDWIRYEPRMQNQRQGNIRARVKEWVDHLLFIGYDIAVSDRTGKAMDAPEGSPRTIYPIEQPIHWAKTRSLQYAIPYPRGSADLWNILRQSKATA